MQAPNVAIIEAFYPGVKGSEAIAGAIFAMAAEATTVPVPVPVPVQSATSAAAPAEPLLALLAPPSPALALLSTGSAKGGHHLPIRYSSASYVDRFGRMPYSVYRASWVSRTQPRDAMVTASDSPRTDKRSFGSRPCIRSCVYLHIRPSVRSFVHSSLHSFTHGMARACVFGPGGQQQYGRDEFGCLARSHIPIPQQHCC
jgi:hypothetical protein